MKKRIISVFLVWTLILPCFAVPTSAALALPGGVVAGTTGVIAASALAAVAKTVVNAVSMLSGATSDNVQAVLDYLVSVTGYGNLGHEKLQAACNTLNQISANPDKYASRMYQNGVDLEISGWPVNDVQFYEILVDLTAYRNDLIDGWHIINHQDYGYVIVNQDETFILSDSVGRYPYAQEITDKWLGSRTALSASTVHLLTDYSMKDLQAVHETLHPDWSFRRTNVTLYDGKYTVLQAASDGIHYDQILCDELGFPYGIPQGNTQMGSDRDYNNDKEGQPEVSDEPIVDIDGDLVMQMFPDGSFTWINNLLYDASEKTYYLDSSATYNTTNNYTYNYEWHYTYHIDYTSITYIGQTEEYDEKYEYYFDLPDGRSSADLTADELLVLNTQIDVLPYVRSADDVSIRALYHFDGNTRDSSYWSHLGNLKWNKGATLTYMDVGAFNGALYLDENEHDFTITLPSNVSTGDFTLQFRFYQSHTEAPVTDSYVKLGGYVLFGFDGASIKNAPGVDLSPMPTGTWNELCFMRKDGDFAYFLNGVCLYSGKNFTRAFNNQLQFTFGNQQQTFKYLDEIRFVSKAIYSMDGYTPSSVPFDTNLSLVLPDSKLPVADAYWSIVSEKENLLAPYGLDSWINLSESDLPSLTHTALTSYTRVSAGSNYYTYQPGPVLPYTSAVVSSASPAWSSYINSTGCNFLSSPTGTAFVATSNSLFSGNGVTSTTVPVTTYNTAISSSPLAYSYFVGAFPYGFNFFCGADHNKTVKTFIPTGKTYTLSMVAADGSIGSFSFDLSSTHTLNERYSYVFNGYEFGFAWVETWAESTSAPLFSRLVFFIVPTSFGSQSEFLYMQLVEGDSTDLTAEYVESVVVMDKDDLNTPSLAVRTDLDITGYQIGGVRPSLPTKGLVWALVEGSRITSLQIYDGQAWEQVDGRIWTGSRWVPYYAYDVLLLKDLWDIVEADPTLDPIYTETGFWTWLQNAWGGMINRLDAIIAALGGSAPGGSTSSPDSSTTFPGEEDNPETEEDEGWVLIDLFVILKDGAWTIVKGVVSTGVNGIAGFAQGVSDLGGFFDAYRPDTSGGVLDIMNQGGSAVWD